MVRVRCEPICGIWRYMLQAWHNKLEACRTLMGKVAGCKLGCVVDYTYLSLLPSFLPSLHASSGYLYSAFLRCRIHGCKTRLCRVLRQRWNVPTELFTFLYATPPSFFSPILLACETGLTLYLNFPRRKNFVKFIALEKRIKQNIKFVVFGLSLTERLVGVENVKRFHAQYGPLFRTLNLNLKLCVLKVN